MRAGAPMPASCPRGATGGQRLRVCLRKRAAFGTPPCPGHSGSGLTPEGWGDDYDPALDRSYGRQQQTYEC